MFPTESTKTTQSFREVDALGPAFLGLQLYLLLSVIDAQGNDLLHARRSRIPSRLASTLILLHRLGPLSVTALGAHLGMSHQLTAHRVRALRELGLLSSKPDPGDQRKSLLKLTRAGTAEARRLVRTCREATAAYEGLFDELGCNLFDVLVRAREALRRRPLEQRTAKPRRA